jgi:hypothetical protein
MATPLQITIDCTDASRMARFWREALHYVEMAPPDGSATWVDYFRQRGLAEDELAEIEEQGYDKIVDPDGVGPRIWFQPVPEGKVVKNRVHLDLDLTGRTQPLPERKVMVNAEVERLQSLGATIFRVLNSDDESFDYYAVVMQDPEGNEFCVS